MPPNSHFTRAQAVWPRALVGQMNTWVSFHLRVPPSRARPTLRLAAATMYRVWVNGLLRGHGPARAGHHLARVDLLPLPAPEAHGWDLVIEVSDYGVPSFDATHEPAFLRAEVVEGKRVLAHTATHGGGFVAEHRPERVQRVERYSYQRGFSEAYRFGATGLAWREPGYVPVAPPPLHRVTHARTWLPRGVGYPDLSVLRPAPRATTGTAVHRPKQAAAYVPMTYITDVPKTSRGFPLDEIAWPFFPLLAGLVYRESRPTRPERQGTFTLRTRQWRRFDFRVIQTGFPALRLRARRASQVVLYFDEALTDGHIGVTKAALVNGLRLELAAGAALDFTAFEPHTLRYLQVLVWRGEVECADVRLIGYGHASPIGDGPAGLGAVERLVRRAAVATFRQNALDVFMDCPSRERAGWLCDSLFTARAEWHYTGDNPIERAFLENYLRPARFAGLPPGMVPMCYPAEPLQGQFIPNWAMFLVLQLDEARHQRGLPAAWRPLIERRVRGLLRYFRRFENEHGLLEKLENWVFVEWSQANAFVQDVNFPTNMLYAATLRAAARLLGDAHLRRRADRVNQAVRALAWRDGRFVDNAVRQADGRLEVTTHATEVAQYYAWFTGQLDPDEEPALWRRLVREDYGDLHPANAFVGKLFRLERLVARGEHAAARRELVANFAPMARQTGTLWEMLDASASRNHGFTSYVGVLIDRLAAARAGR
jgi:alpha-L-rhamnosidase